MSQPHHNPFFRARQEWHGIFANNLASKRHWQIFAFLQSLVILTLIITLTVLSNRSHIIPYIVEVDKLGRATAYKPASAASFSHPAVIRAQLYRFIETSRSVITDPATMRKYLRETYQMVTPSLKHHFFDPYYQKNNPLQLAQTLSRQVRPVAFLKQATDTYLIEWQETTRDSAHALISETQWKALVTIKNHPPESLTEITKNPLNPFGLYITDLSWSQLH